MRQVIGFQGAAAENAANLAAGQEVVVNALQERFSEAAAVNVDVEMAHLLNLQTLCHEHRGLIRKTDAGEVALGIEPGAHREAELLEKERPRDLATDERADNRRLFTISDAEIAPSGVRQRL